MKVTLQYTFFPPSHRVVWICENVIKSATRLIFTRDWTSDVMQLHEGIYNVRKQSIIWPPRPTTDILEQTNGYLFPPRAHCNDLRPVSRLMNIWIADDSSRPPRINAYWNIYWLIPTCLHLTSFKKNPLLGIDRKTNGFNTWIWRSLSVPF